MFIRREGKTKVGENIFAYIHGRKMEIIVIVILFIKYVLNKTYK